MRGVVVRKRVKAALICALLLQDGIVGSSVLADDTNERTRLFKVACELPTEISARLGLEVSTVNLSKLNKLLWGMKKMQLDPDVVHILVLYSNNLPNPPKVRRQSAARLFECLRPTLNTKYLQNRSHALKAGESSGSHVGEDERASIVVGGETSPPSTKGTEEGVTPASSYENSSVSNDVSDTDRMFVNPDLAPSRPTRHECGDDSSEEISNVHTAEGSFDQDSSNIVGSCMVKGPDDADINGQLDGAASVTDGQGTGSTTPSECADPNETANDQKSDLSSKTSDISRCNSAERNVPQYLGGRVRRTDDPLSLYKSTLDHLLEPPRARSTSMGEYERLVGGPKPRAYHTKSNPGIDTDQLNAIERRRATSLSLGPNSPRWQRPESSVSKQFSGSHSHVVSGDERVSSNTFASYSRGSHPTKAARANSPSMDRVLERPKSPLANMKTLKKGVSSAVKTFTRKFSPKHSDVKGHESTSAHTIQSNLLQADDVVESKGTTVDKSSSEPAFEGAHAFRRDDLLRKPIVIRRSSDLPTSFKRDNSVQLDPTDGSKGMPPSHSIMPGDIYAAQSDDTPPHQPVEYPCTVDDVDACIVSDAGVDESIPYNTAGHTNTDRIVGKPYDTENADSLYEGPTNAMSLDVVDPRDGPAGARHPGRDCGSNITNTNDRTLEQHPFGENPQGYCAEGTGGYDTECTLDDPRDREVLNNLIDKLGLCKLFHEYARSRYIAWELSLKEMMRRVCGIDHFRDDYYLYDTDEGLVADIVDWHDPGPYGSYYPQDLVLQASHNFVTVEFEEQNRHIFKVAHRVYGGWFEPQVMIIFKSKDSSHRDRGWSLSKKRPVNGVSNMDMPEEVLRFVASVDREDRYLDITATGTLKRFPLWYYMYIKTGMTIEEGMTALTVPKIFRSFDLYTRSNAFDFFELDYDMEKIENIAAALLPQVPISSSPLMDMLLDFDADDSVGAFQQGYLNLLADMDVILSGDGILRVPAFVKRRKTLFEVIVTFVCLNILVTLLSLVAVFVMAINCSSSSNRGHVSSYSVLWDMVRFSRWWRR